MLQTAGTNPVLLLLRGFSFMETEFKGKVLIHSLPTLEAAQEVYKMLRQVHPEAGKERLLNLMRQRPIRLIDAVSADEAMEVVDHLKSFGMSASFELDPPTFFVLNPWQTSRSCRHIWKPNPAVLQGKTESSGSGKGVPWH